MDFGNFGNAAGGAGLLNSLFGLLGIGKGQNPSDVANKYLEGIPGQTLPYYQPYMNAGNESISQLLKMLGQNPTDTYNDLAGGYKESPGYKFQLEQALNAGTNANAAGGTLGTPYHQQMAQETAQGVASKDFNEYMKNLLGLHSQQESGYGSLAGLGANAANQYAGGLAGNAQQMSQNAYAGQAGQNSANNQNWSNAFSSIPWFFLPH